ncbi:MAG: caspase family protein [Desulfobacteraceae bacterium]|uniref:Caspase family protein n=1 Tax=Candidatus Desulfaltia bathyphila TaxID=2841697 RepID=A0A8J6N7N9_9BACT|nr:caspase family protein [Candidatus Desulfaltia bathyphila]MBL7195597.1 caspase family protein [Desulfobacterales bacterium]
MEIKFKILDKETYLGIPVINAKANGVLSIKAPNRIELSYKTFGTWMIVGTSVWKTEWLIDYIDLDNNVIGAYYAISGGGPLCGGGGKGYLLAKFPEKPKKPLPLPVTSKPPEKVAVAQTKERIKPAPVVVEPEKPLSPPEITIPAEEPQIAPREEKIKPAPVVVEPEKPLLPPILSAHVLLRDASGNQVLDSGEEITLKVEVENRGEGAAKDVQVALSGNQSLINCLGEDRFLGDIKAGEKKTATFKAVLPSVIVRETVELRIEIKEMTGATHERKKIKVAMRPSEVKETVEIISELPYLVFTTQLKDRNNNRVLDGGEEVILKVKVENRGEAAARDVQVALSGNQSLINCLGEDRFLGDIKAGEKKTATFKAVLPANIPSVTARLKIEIKESKGFSSLEIKVLRIAMRPVEVKEIVEIISEVNVDDIPKKVKGFENKNNVALIIGISDYREKLIPTVKYAARDAEIIAKYLEKLGGIPRSNIKLLTDDTATKSDIEAYSEDWLPRRVNQDSTVFIYYAGHGTPDPQGREAYIVPYEGHPDFPSKLYPLKKMYESLNKLPAKDVIVMLDSCFSGAKGRSITREGARPITISIENPVLSGGKITVIAGSTGNQISSDYDKVQHGLFTYYLLRGIRGEADINRNDVVELGELYRYVRTNVSEKASLELNRDQTPVLLPSEVSAGDRLKIPVTRTR